MGFNRHCQSLEKSPPPSRSGFVFSVQSYEK
jgi:hypothetical protein